MTVRVGPPTVGGSDIVSTIAGRLAKLDRQLDEGQRDQVASHAEGQGPGELAARLLASIDPNQTQAEAVARFALAEGEEPTEAQLEEVERDRIIEALKPFMTPQLRDTILNINRVLDQVIDETTIDVLLDVGFDEAAVESARSKLDDFRQFIEDNKDEIEALQILYSRHYRAGLRYGQVKQLRDELRKPPLALHDPAAGLWSLYEAVEPEKVKGHGGKALVDLVALVRHAIEPEEPLVPVPAPVEARR